MAFPLFLIPLAIEAGRAISSGIKAGKERKISDAADAQIPLNDPVQERYLGRMERQERFYRAGTDAPSAFTKHNIRDAAAQTQSNFMRAGGSSVTQGLLRSQGVANKGYADVGATASVAADNMLGAQGQLINLMASRRYDRQRYRRDLALMRSTQAHQDSNDSINAMTAMIPGIGKSIPAGGGDRSTPAGSAGVPMRSAANAPAGNYVQPGSQPSYYGPAAGGAYAMNNLTSSLLTPRY